MTFQRTPGMSPIAPPRVPPIPSTNTSSCSSIKFNAPSPGRKAVINLPFLISWVRTHLRIALFGCLLSMPTFSSTIPLLIGAPSIGSTFWSSLSIRRLKYRSDHRKFFRFFFSCRAENSPLGDLEPILCFSSFAQHKHQHTYINKTNQTTKFRRFWVVLDIKRKTSLHTKKKTFWSLNFILLHGSLTTLSKKHNKFKPTALIHRKG